MPRGLTTNQKAAIAARVSSLSYFVHLDLASPAADIRVWNGVGPLTIGADTWSGVGELGVIDGIAGDRTLKAQQITLALVGVPGDSLSTGVIAETRSVRYQGRPLNIYLGIMHPDTGALIDSLVPIWAGFADVLSFSLGSSSTVALTGSHFDTHMRRTNGFNMSTVSHNARFGLPDNTDLFFEANDRLMGTPKAVLS